MWGSRDSRGVLGIEPGSAECMASALPAIIVGAFASVGEGENQIPSSCRLGRQANVDWGMGAPPGWELFINPGWTPLLKQLPPHPHIPGAQLPPDQQTGDRWILGGQEGHASRGLGELKPKTHHFRGCAPSPFPLSDIPKGAPRH